MRHFSILLTVCLLILSQAGFGQSQNTTVTTNKAKVSWNKNIIDSTLNPTCCDKLSTTAIVNKYKPQVDKFGATIAVCPTGLDRGYPEAPLSDWAVDILYDYARCYLDTTGKSDMPLDFALLNFGGMRTEMPKGNVSRLDILSIFPFDNYLVIVELPGTSVRKLMQYFADTKIQAMSHVKIGIKERVEGQAGEIVECLINGEPIDENKLYNVATIDFLLNGGDGLYALGLNNGVIKTSIKVMDLIISSVENLTKEGKVIEKELDNRGYIVK